MLRWMTSALALAALSCGDDGAAGVDAGALDAASADAAGLDASPVDAAAIDVDARVIPECSATGAANVDGVVAGRALDAVARVALSMSPDGLVVVQLREDGEPVCGGAATSATALTLAFSCPPIDIGEYPVRGSIPQPCPAEGKGVLSYVQGGGGILALAEAGGVTIEAVTAECVRGTFDLAFPAGEGLVGAFSAVVCP